MIITMHVNRDEEDKEL